MFYLKQWIVIIQKADKGNTVVIVDRDKYVESMKKLLSDTSKFVKVQFNVKHKVNKEIRNIIDVEADIKSYLDDLRDSNYLSDEPMKNVQLFLEQNLWHLRI